MRDGAVKNFIWEVFRAVIAAVIFSLAAVLIFALIIKLFLLPSSVITIVNRVIKAVAVFGGCLLFIKEERGIFKGAAAGVLAVAVTYLIFAAIAGSGFTYLFFAELLFGCAIGAISGIIAVNIRK